MGMIEQANEIVKAITLPKEVRLKFEDFDIKGFKVQTYVVKSDPYLISSDKSLKIYLRFPFYVFY